MKQIKLLTIAVLVIATTSHAQINKGSMALGGNIYFNSERSKYDNGAKVKTTSFSISPSY